MHIQIFEINNFNELSEKLSKTDKSSLILLDIDDTVITPRANIFRYKNNPYFPFIDNIKKNKEHIPNFIEILSHWRLKRQTILIHEEWPDLIDKIKTKSIVLGLTQMETGTFGQIDTMEEWRINELNEKKIRFSEIVADTILMKNEHGYATIYKGIIMTGPFTKSQVLSQAIKILYLNKIDFVQIIMVDDRIEQINDVANLADNLKINFIGIHYRGVVNIQGEVNLEIAELQKKYLLEQCKWYEDHEIKI